MASSVLLAAAPVFAQDDDEEPTDKPPAPAKTTKDPAPAETTEAPAEDTEADKPAPTEKSEPAPTNKEPEPAPETEKPEPEKTTEKPEPEKTTEKPEPEKTTEAPEPEKTTEEPPPPLTTEEPESAVDEEPTIAEGIDGPALTGIYAIPTYAPAAVPPTQNAPFMQHSSAPEGTVFIAVGAILGAFGLGILIWRIIVGLLLHRSVERAAMAQHDTKGKAGFPAPPAPFYKYTDQGSNMSLSGGAAAGRGVRRTNRGPIPSSNPSQSNLFFSPTAAVSSNSGNRGSTFLPAGFYAASGSANQGHGHSISLTNLRPDSRGHGAARNPLGPSPPDSPGFPTARRDISNSSLGRPSSQRAPSAYLDDLLADDPGALPPPHMPPSTGPRSPSNLGPSSNRL
ncbi:hypothetical protein ACO1O0_008941 [Amphichorda felina]